MSSSSSPVEFPYPSVRSNNALFEAIAEAYSWEDKTVVVDNTFLVLRPSPQTILGGKPILFAREPAAFRRRQLSFRLRRDRLYINVGDEYYRMNLTLTPEGHFQVPLVPVAKEEFPPMTPTKVERPAFTFLRHSVAGTREIAVTYPEGILTPEQVEALIQRLDYNLSDQISRDNYTPVQIEGEGMYLTPRPGRNVFHQIGRTTIDVGGLHPEVLSSEFQIHTQDIGYFYDIVAVYNDDEYTYIVTRSLGEIFVTWINVKKTTNVAV